MITPFLKHYLAYTVFVLESNFNTITLLKALGAVILGISLLGGMFRYFYNDHQKDRISYLRKNHILKVL